MSVVVNIFYSQVANTLSDRSARLKGLEEDLHMTGRQFNTLISIMYVGYVLSQIPSYVFCFLHREALVLKILQKYVSQSA